MVSWVVDRVLARSADGRVAHVIIVYREADRFGDFRRDKWRLRAITESLLECEQRSLTEWYVPSLDLVLVAERELPRSSLNVVAYSRPTLMDARAITASPK